MITTSPIIEASKEDFLRSKAYFEAKLASTPDDRLNWSPTPLCRSILLIAAHSAMAVKAIREVIEGTLKPEGSIAELDARLREEEKQFTTRAQVLAELETNSKSYLAWLDSLSPQKLESSVTLPFIEMPLERAITIMPSHLMSHAAQIDYVQTAYGDYDWRMG